MSIIRIFEVSKNISGMRTKRIEFKNSEELDLSARLELPAGAGTPAQFAIFAHCFTCGKNAKATTTISRALTQSGFGVLRFDFTGLGQSEGEFSDTGFSTNVQDIVDAAAFLEEFYLAPSLLIGHSLGGTAVIHAASKIKSVLALCTIGAPFDAAHVLNLFGKDRAELREKGSVKVRIASRDFTIGDKFLKDLEISSTAEVLSKLKKPILIMHSPQDEVVSIQNAADIYSAAFHPKSFISLDGTNHLLTNNDDANYAAHVLGAWVSRYISKSNDGKLKTDKQVAVQIGSDGFTTEVVAGEHYFLADEPKSVGGNNLGPSPYQLLNAALGACTAMTLKMYADRKKWPLEKATVHLSHNKEYSKDSANPEERSSRIDVFERVLELEGNLSQDQLQRLMEIANKCPVHRTLTDSSVEVKTTMKRD